MGYDTVHLGDHHGQTTLWGGTGRTLTPGDQVTLRDDVRATIGPAGDYDVDLQGTAVHIRGGAIQPGTLPPADLILTTWGEPVPQLDPDAAGREQQRLLDQTRQLYAALGADPGRASTDLEQATDTETPQHCSVCLGIRA
jgi:hypothetical protein